MKEYSLSLILDDESADMVREISEIMKLDFGDFIPHVTLLWLDSAPENLDYVNAEVFTLDIQNTYVAHKSKRDAWFGLSVNKTPNLISLQAGLAEQLSSDIDINKQLPHITTGHTLTHDQYRAVDFLSVLNYNFPIAMKAQLRLCRNGEHGKVIEVL